jgi:stalled ribosome rescue protein Dom34
MAGRRSYGKTITVHRRGFTNKFGTKVKAKTFKEKDRGLPGHSGIKTNLKSGTMNNIAREMGYASSTAVPEMHIDSFVKRLVKRYGKVTAERKIQEMINLRSHEEGEAKQKFEMMKASFERQYG